MPKKLDLKPVLEAVNPEEAIAYFRQKGYRIGFDHQDVWQQEHQAAFTVAKAMHLDLLQDIRKELDAALATGSTQEEFAKQLTPRLQARGWWGKQEMVDPVDGQAKLVQLGSPRRLQTIFDTNVATAYSEGQWERIQRNQELFPFLEYVRSASANPRHTHLAYAGLVLPATDSFWQSHLPIKEWGCKCTVIQHNRRSLEREGLTVGTAPPEVMRSLVNKRTGEVMQVPTGVDPAFHYPPGGRRAHLEKMLVDKRITAGFGANEAATAAAADMVRATANDANRMVHGFGRVPERAAKAAQALTGVDVSEFNLAMVGAEVRHVLKGHGNAVREAALGQVAVTVEDFARIATIAEDFDDMQLGKIKPGDPLALVLRKRFAAQGLEPAMLVELVLNVRTNPKRKRLVLKTLYKRLLKSD